MGLENLAEKLIAASNKSEREKLLEQYSESANFALANELKEICYKFWTIEPIKAQQASFALETLADFQPEPKIISVKTWIGGIAAITRGENENSVRLLDEAAGQFLALGDELTAAQTQVAKIYALALLGEYETAIETGERALKIFEKHRDFFAAARLEHNLGNLSWRRDRYRDAEKYYESAWQHYLAIGDEQHLAMLENSYAVIKTFQNDFRTAEKLYAQALTRAQRENMSVTEAEIEASRGNLAFFRGRYDEALKHLEKSRQNYARLKMPHQSALADLEIADVYLELNLLPEAIEVYERVAPQFASLKMKAEEARARTQFGKALAQSGKTANALAELEKAVEIYRREENAVGEATANLIKARLFLKEKRFSEAKQLTERAAKAFQIENNVRNFLFARWLVGTIESETSEFNRSETIFSETLKAAEKAEQTEVVWLCENSLGKLALIGGDQKQAEKHFRQAVSIVETMRAPLAADEFRTAYIANKLQPFSELADIFRRSPETVAESFVWTERGRSQALLDLLGEQPGENRAESASAANSELQNSLDARREELNWFYSLLHRPQKFGERQANATELANWQSEIRRLESEINRLILQAGVERNRLATSFREIDLKKLQAKLGNRILLEFTEFKGETAAFVVTANSLRLIENLGNATEVQEALEKLHFQFGALRYGATALEKYLPELKRRARLPLENLYEILLRPLEDFLGEKPLVIIPFGNMHYVPFHALHDGERFVIERQAVSYAPSASVWQFLEEREKKEFNKILAVGFADERVPQVETEVLSLAETTPETKVLIGEAATFAALRENLLKEKFDALHLACHGQFRAENPLFSSLHLSDGWATVRDVSLLRLDGALVVLSACETGLSRISSGDELLGLVRGFLAAGASSLVLTLWTVSDEAAAEIAREFYRNLRNKLPLAESLRAAQIKMIERDLHPYFWSPFALVGNN